MDKQKFLLILSFAAIIFLVMSMPLAWVWGGRLAMPARWVGIILTVIYFVLRSKFSKEN